MIQKLKINFSKLILDLLETNKWLKTFNSDGILILNYGDLLANFPQNSLDKEDSVKIMNDIINLVKKILSLMPKEFLIFL